MVNKGQHGQKMSKMVKNSQKCFFLNNKNGQQQSKIINTAKSGQKWKKPVNSDKKPSVRPLWSKMVKTVKNGQRRSTTVKNSLYGQTGPSWSKTV